MKNEKDEDSSIVIVEHNSSSDYNNVRQPAPMPGLEIAHEVERTPLRARPQMTSRILVRRQGRAIRLPWPVEEMEDGIRYTHVCLFTLVLRKPEKILRQMPEVAKARRTEIEGLYDAGCLEWSMWAEADREKIKPIRTGFVGAIKVDEASGVSKYKSRLVIYGNQMVPFQHFNPYETSPVAQHIFLLTLCSLLFAMNAHIKHIDFSQACSHADMGETCYAIPPDDFRKVSALVSTVEMEDLSTDKVYEVSHIEAMEMASGVRYDRTGLRISALYKYVGMSKTICQSFSLSQSLESSDHPAPAEIGPKC
eukprot:g3258.t1